MSNDDEAALAESVTDADDEGAQEIAEEVADEVAEEDAAPHVVDRTPLLLWAGVALVSVIVRSLSAGGGWALDRWDTLAQWESSSYLTFADHGGRSEDGFLPPTYGLLIRLLTWITGNRITTAVLISYAASAAAAWLLWDWLGRREVERMTRVWSVLTLLVFPYSFVLFGVVGAESLTLALVLGAFVLHDHEQPIAAGLLGALAITTSLMALAVVPAFLALAWTKRSGAAEGARRLLPALLSLVGPVALTIYSWLALEDALIPWRGDGGFRGVSTGVFRPATWIRLTWIVEGGADASWTLETGAQALLLIAALVTSVWIGRRFGVAMGVFVVGCAFFAVLGDIDTISAGRRLTLAFPLAAFAGVGIARLPRPVAGAIVLVSAVAMFAHYSFFVRSIGFPYW